jgi:hypothetical protein
MEANASRYHGKAPEEIVWAQPEPPDPRRQRQMNFLAYEIHASIV